MLQAPRVPPDEDFRFRAAVRTRWSDEDMQGVLNNAVHATLCEEARYAYFERLGLLGAERHFTFVLLQSNLRFLAPGSGPADVEVAVRTTRVGSRSFTQAYRIGPAGEAPWAEGEAVLVAWDPQTRGSTALSDDFRRAVLDFEGLRDPA